jgi:signal peptidase II
MNDGERKRTVLIYGVILFIIVLDQITKFVVKQSMNLYESIGVIGDFFRLTYIENPGMAFGIQFENKILFTILSIAAAVIVLIYLLRMTKEKFIFRMALALILGGAIGNLIDRLINGRVVDFFDFEFFDISLPAFKFLFLNFPGYDMTRWPVFNIADSAVTCGMLLLTYIIFTQKAVTKQEISLQSDQ